MTGLSLEEYAAGGAQAGRKTGRCQGSTRELRNYFAELNAASHSRRRQIQQENAATRRGQAEQEKNMREKAGLSVAAGSGGGRRRRGAAGGAATAASAAPRAAKTAEGSSSTKVTGATKAATRASQNQKRGGPVLDEGHGLAKNTKLPRHSVDPPPSGEPEKSSLSFDEACWDGKRWTRTRIADPKGAQHNEVPSLPSSKEAKPSGEAQAREITRRKRYSIFLDRWTDDEDEEESPRAMAGASSSSGAAAIEVIDLECEPGGSDGTGEDCPPSAPSSGAGRSTRMGHYSTTAAAGVVRDPLDEQLPSTTPGSDGTNQGAGEGFSLLQDRNHAKSEAEQNADELRPSTRKVKAKASPKRIKRSRDQQENPEEEENISEDDGARPRKRDGNSPFVGEAVVGDSKD